MVDPNFSHTFCPALDALPSAASGAADPAGVVVGAGAPADGVGDEPESSPIVAAGGDSDPPPTAPGVGVGVVVSPAGTEAEVVVGGELVVDEVAEVAEVAEVSGGVDVAVGAALGHADGSGAELVDAGSVPTAELVAGELGGAGGVDVPGVEAGEDERLEAVAGDGSTVTIGVESEVLLLEAAEGESGCGAGLVSSVPAGVVTPADKVGSAVGTEVGAIVSPGACRTIVGSWPAAPGTM